MGGMITRRIRMVTTRSVHRMIPRRRRGIGMTVRGMIRGPVAVRGGSSLVGRLRMGRLWRTLALGFASSFVRFLGGGVGGLSARVALPNLDPFRVLVLVFQQVIPRVGVVLKNYPRVPAVVHWPKHTNLLANHAIGAEPR